MTAYDIIVEAFKTIDCFESELRYDVESYDHWYGLEYNHTQKTVSLTLYENYCDFKGPNSEIIYSHNISCNNFLSVVIELFDMKGIDCWEDYFDLLHIKEVRTNG